MKKIYYGYIIAAVLLVHSCQKTEELTDKNFKPKTQSGLRPEGDGLFYYAGDQKIPLTEDSSAVIFLDADSSRILGSLRTKGNGSTVTRLNSGYFLADKKSKSEITTLSGKAVVQHVFKNVAGKRVVPTGEIVVKLRPGTTIDQIIKESAGKLKVVRATKRGWYLLRLDGQASLLDVANGLQESGRVKYSYPNFIANVRKSSIDPYFAYQYYLYNSVANTRDVNLGTVGYGMSTNIKVAVLDDGVEAHEDLTGRILQGFTPGYPTEYGAPYGTVDVYGDPVGHGQACAGIIAATRDNNTGIAGIAPLASIVPVNIFKTGVSEQDIADAINWAWDDGGADVINNSWGIYDNPGPIIAIEEAIDDALTLGRAGKGCVVVFSSGNDNEPLTLYPSGLSGVVTVGAITKQGVKQSYSSYGAGMDLVAPSGLPGQTGSNGQLQLNGDVYSTDRMGTPGYSSVNYINLFGGTSAAAPQVSGAAALLLSYNPNLTGTQVASYLTSTAVKLGVPNWEASFGYGLLNITAAYNSVFTNTFLSNSPYIQIVGPGQVNVNSTLPSHFDIVLSGPMAGKTITDTQWIIPSFYGTPSWQPTALDVWTNGSTGGAYLSAIFFIDGVSATAKKFVKVAP